MSFSIVTGGCFFDKGITVADFHNAGCTPSVGELVNIAGANGLSVPMVVYWRTRGFVHFNSESITLTVNLAASGCLMSKTGVNIVVLAKIRSPTQRTHSWSRLDRPHLLIV